MGMNKNDFNITNNITINNQNNAELDKLKAQMEAIRSDSEHLTSQLSAARAEAVALGEELRSYKHGNGIEILESELERFRNTAEQSTIEFRNFLESVNLNDGWGYNDWQFESLFDQIKDGSITAAQAITQVKTEFRALMEENYNNAGGLFDSKMVQSFTASMEHLGETISTVLAKIENMEQNGVRAIGEAGSSAGGAGGIADVLKQIEKATAGMSKEAKAAYEPVTNLVKSIVEYGNIDSTKILGISQAFRNIADIGTGSYGSKSIENIVYLAKQLQALSSSGGGAIRFDFTGFNDLKVSKASISNLATYLPRIAKIDSTKLESLSNINLTNFNNIRIPKSSVEGITNLAEVFQRLKDVMSAYTDVAKQVEAAAAKSVLGDGVESATNKVQKLINKLEILSIKAQESNATVKHSTAYDANGTITTGQDDTGTESYVKAADAIDRLTTSVQRYKDTLTPETEQKAFNSEMDKFNSKMESIKFAIDEDTAALANYRKSERENLKDTNALSKAIVATNRAYKQATESVQKYTAAKNGKSSREYQELEKSAESLKVLNDRLNSGTISEQEYVRETNRLRASIQQCTAIIKANGEAHLSLGNKIKVTAEKFGQYFTVAKLVQTAWRATRQMIQAAIELDDAFTQLKIVTGATDSEMENLSKTAINLSKNLGQSVTDVAKSIETFSRLGYNLPDASKLAEYATILSNTASISMDEATTGLTSIIKGFNLSVEDTEHVSDVLIQVGQKYAVSAGELMEAFERSGAALNATNVSFEKSAGLIAAANASVQDSSTVGTALKTVSARIRGSKSDLEELGEDTEDLVEGFSKYAKEIQALTGFDIMVEGSTTEFKDLYDIMQGIAQVWSGLSGTSQSRVAEILGGTRQLQVISSIIGNWKDAAGAYTDAIDSAGVATKANDTYMESATAHINQFKASFEELSSDILSSKLIGGIVDVGSKIMEILDRVSNLLGGLPGDLTGLAVAISTVLSFKNVGELIKQFQFLIILRIEYAHEALN